MAVKASLRTSVKFKSFAGTTVDGLKMGFLSAILECAQDKTETEEPKQEREAVAAVIACARTTSSELSEKLKAPCPGELPSATRRRELAQRLDDAVACLRAEERHLLDELLAARARFERVDLLADCTAELRSADRLHQRRRFKDAAETYERVHERLRQLPMILDDLAEAADRLRRIATLKRAKCLCTVTERWRNRLHYNNTGFRVDVQDPENLQEILDALFVSGGINCEVALIANFFSLSIFPSIISGKCGVKVQRDQSHVQLSLVESVNDIKSSIDNLITAFDAVQSTIDCRWEDDRSVFSVWGQIAGGAFFDTLTDQLEAQIEPIDPQLVKKLNGYLCEIRFIEEHKSPLRKFCSADVDRIHDKKCERLLSTARALIGEDMRGSGTLRVLPAVNNRPEVDFEQTKMYDWDMSDKGLLKDSFATSEYCISKNVKDLIETVLNEVEAAQNFSIHVGNRVISTIRNVLEMYHTLVPQYHSDALNTDPRYIGLFYNNCHYLAHTMVKYPWMKIISKEFATNLNMQLVHVIYNMRISAILKFSDMLRSQQQYIENIISQSDLNTLEREIIIGWNGESALKTCFERLLYLQECWQSLLSEDVYVNTMSELIGCLCKVLVDIILRVKERVIDEDLAHDLSNLFQGSVIDLAPNLFKNQSDISKLSRHYGRLNQLVALLKMPMFTIASCWNAEGGELQKFFTCEEVKHVVRIMFPGSLQKSAVLDMLQ